MKEYTNINQITDGIIQLYSDDIAIESEDEVGFRLLDSEFIREELLDIINAKLGTDYQFYNDNGDWLIVLNVKNKGFPDLDKLENELRKLGYMEDVVEKFLTPDTGDINIYDIWQEQVRFDFENLESEFSENIVVTGRSGGYWGFDEDISYFVREDVNTDVLEDYIFKESDRIFEGIKEDIQYEIDIEDSVSDGYIVTIASEFVPDIVLNDATMRELDSLESMLTFDEISVLEDFSIKVNGIIKDMEDIDMWVDLIENNNWLEDVEVNM